MKKKFFVGVALIFVLIKGACSLQTYEANPEAVKIIEEVKTSIATLHDDFPQSIIDSLVLQCQKAMDIDQNYIDAYAYLSLSYFLKGSTEGAIKTIDKAINIEQDNPDVYFIRGSIFFSRVEEDDSFLEKVTIDLLKVLSLNPQYKSPKIQNESLETPEIMLMVSHCYTMLNKFEDAEKILQKIIREYPNTQWQEEAKTAIDHFKKTKK